MLGCIAYLQTRLRFVAQYLRPWLVIAMYVLRMYDTQPEYLQPVTKKKVHTEHSQSLNMTAPPLTPASGPTLALPTSRKPNFM